MFQALTVTWLGGTLAVITWVVSARRRRGVLSRELHELRGSLTAARLAVDLMPVLDLDRPSVCRAASDELERSYRALGEFEDLFHARLFAPPRNAAARVAVAPRPQIDARAELERLTLIWAEAARREGRTLMFEWDGRRERVRVAGPRRPFAEVISNLLSNALRHGDGTISVRARVRSGVLRVEVRDEGPGLAGPLGDRPRSGRHGHGLSVALRSARRLGGTVSSGPASRGAAITFSVPVERDSSELAVTVGGDS